MLDCVPGRSDPELLNAGLAEKNLLAYQKRPRASTSQVWGSTLARGFDASVHRIGNGC